jgi:hypothetical protein
MGSLAFFTSYPVCAAIVSVGMAAVIFAVSSDYCSGLLGAVDRRVKQTVAHHYADQATF